MPESNPFGQFRSQCETSLRNAFTKVFPWLYLPGIELKAPPSPNLGELTSPILFEFSKKLGKSPQALAEQIIAATSLLDAPLVDSIKVAGPGTSTSMSIMESSPS